MRRARIGFRLTATNHVKVITNNNLDFVATRDVDDFGFDIMLANAGMGGLPGIDRCAAARPEFHDFLEVEDVGVVKFANGAVGTIASTVNICSRNLEETLYVFDEDGIVKISGISYNNADVCGFVTERDGCAPCVDAAAGRNDLEIVLSTCKSQQTGQSVRIPLTNFAGADMRGEF